MFDLQHPHQQYKILFQLGAGTSSEVYSGIDTVTGVPVAIKIIDYDENRFQNQPQTIDTTDNDSNNGNFVPKKTKFSSTISLRRPCISSHLRRSSHQNKLLNHFHRNNQSLSSKLCSSCNFTQKTNFSPNLSQFSIKKLNNSITEIRDSYNGALQSGNPNDIYDDQNFISNNGKFIIYDEISTLMKLSHPNIVQLFDVIEVEGSSSLDPTCDMKPSPLIDSNSTQKKLWLIMEYLPNGSLAGFMVNGNPLNDIQLYRFFKQISDAIFYLHNIAKVVHRDIKAENILIDENNVAKLADFGLSKGIPTKEALLHTQCGTLNYISPEIITEKGYNEKTDIWSLGILLYLMSTGRFPFEDTNTQNLYKKIILHDVEFPEEPILNSSLKDLILKMLEKDPEKRYSIIDVISHPWVENAAKVNEMSSFPSAITIEDNQEVDNLVREELKVLGIEVPKMMLPIQERIGQIGIPKHHGRIIHPSKPSPLKLQINNQIINHQMSDQSITHLNSPLNPKVSSHSNLGLPLFKPPTPQVSSNLVGQSEYSHVDDDPRVAERVAVVRKLLHWKFSRKVMYEGRKQISAANKAVLRRFSNTPRKIQRMPASFQLPEMTNLRRQSLPKDPST